MNQIEKNTVSANNQLEETEYVTFINPNGKGKRILFVGNSITRHGFLPEIGWYNDFGMAASCIENDYVHILASKLDKIYPDAVYCVCQVALWETKYQEGESILFEYESAHNFDADIVVMRIIENCKTDDFDRNAFYKEYVKLIKYLNPKNGKVILTSGFWKHVGDEVIEKVAEDFNYPFAYLGELGENDKMKALGLFEHEGVAVHPGDEGMKEIANIIYNKIVLNELEN